MIANINPGVELIYQDGSKAITLFLIQRNCKRDNFESVQIIINA